MDHREDADEDAGNEAEAEKPEAVAPKGAPTKRRKARREARAAREAETRHRASAASAGLSRSVIVGVVALAAGAAVGWFAHDAHAKARLTDESAATAAGNSGPCQDWQAQICGSSGDQSATCLQAKGAAELLTPATCESALTAMPATLAKIKTARASCDSLVKKLCSDLPKGSRTCAMVTERTDSFPTERCKELLEHYDEVLSELKQLDAQGGPPAMGGPQGAPHGLPPGAPHP